MNDNENLKTPQEREARLEQTLALVRKARHRRTTMRLLWVIAALSSTLTVMVARRSGLL